MAVYVHSVPEDQLARLLRIPECQPWCNEYIVYKSDIFGIVVDCACNARYRVRQGETLPATRELPGEMGVNPDFSRDSLPTEGTIRTM